MPTTNSREDSMFGLRCHAEAILQSGDFSVMLIVKRGCILGQWKARQWLRQRGAEYTFGDSSTTAPSWTKPSTSHQSLYSEMRIIEDSQINECSTLENRQHSHLGNSPQTSVTIEAAVWLDTWEDNTVHRHCLCLQIESWWSNQLGPLFEYAQWQAESASSLGWKNPTVVMPFC